MKTFKQFQEGVAALKVGNKFLPRLRDLATAGIVYQAGKEYIKKKFRPKEEDKVGEFWDDVDDNSKDKTKTPPAQPEMRDDINTPLVDKETKFGGHGKKIDAKTRKRMNAPENQFEDAAPTNSVGDGSNVSLPPSYVPGMRKRYAKGGRNSRKPWLDHLKNK